MDYDVLKKRIEVGERRVIDDLVEHLWPHPVAELSVGWRTINTVVRKLAKRDRTKVARIALCILDEYLPCLIPHINNKFAAHIVISMDALRSCADDEIRPRDAWRLYDRYEYTPLASLGVHIRPFLGVGSFNENIEDALYRAFQAILPQSDPAHQIEYLFDHLLGAMCELEPEDWLGPTEQLDPDPHLAKCIGRIESRFAFCDALTAVLE